MHARIQGYIKRLNKNTISLMSLSRDTIVINDTVNSVEFVGQFEPVMILLTVICSRKNILANITL